MRIVLKEGDNTVVRSSVGLPKEPAGDIGPPRARRWPVPGAEWFGQTTASVCWIASVLAYGVHAAGDWLQLGAASAWLLANLAALRGA